MINLYTWGIPNGRKVSIMLNERGLLYGGHRIDLGNNPAGSAGMDLLQPGMAVSGVAS